MDGDPANLALARIEAAMERIRATATRLSASASDLADRHDQLQGAVSEALTEIDAILSGDEG